MTSETTTRETAVDGAQVAQFWVVAALLALTPGADWAYAITAGLRARRALHVAPAVAGMLVGYAAVITAVALGIGTLVSDHPAALTVLTTAGAAYLVWLGIATLRSRPHLPSELAPAPTSQPASASAAAPASEPASASPAAQTTVTAPSGAAAAAGSTHSEATGAAPSTTSGRSAAATGADRRDATAQFTRGVGISAINPKGLLLLLALLPQFTTADGWAPTTQMLALGGLHLLNCALVYTGVALAARRVLQARPTAAVVVTRTAGVVMTVLGAALLVEKLLEQF